jgi:hypothetical protein
VHHFVEWMVEVLIESDMEHAYKTASNEGMTTTDTTRNQCYVVAKKMAQRWGGNRERWWRGERRKGGGLSTCNHCECMFHNTPAI